MAKEHKFARARIEVDSALRIDQILGVARQAVATQRGLKITAESDEAFQVVLANLLGGTILSFVVSAESVGGRTQVVSTIDDYMTSQSTMYFIPIGPKSMLGLTEYRRFMTTFGQAAQAADPSAQIRIIERDDPMAAGGIPGQVPGAVPAGMAPGGVVSAVPVAAVPVPAQALSAEGVAVMPVSSATGQPVVPGVPQQGTPYPGAPIPGAPATGNSLFSVNQTSARVVQIAGAVVLAGGLAFWYGTPSNVTVGPIMVIILGAIIAGVGFVMGRSASASTSNELAQKLRQERLLNGTDPTTQVPASVPVPVQTPAVPAPAGMQIPSVPLPPVPQPTTASAVASIAAARDPAPAPQPSLALLASLPAPTAAPVTSSDFVVESVVPADVPIELEHDTLDRTRVAPAGPHAEWELHLADGRRLSVGSAMRLGRDPSVDPSAPGALLVQLADPAKSVSKTHAQLIVRPGELAVTDLHSTNGSVVVMEGAHTALAPNREFVINGDAELRLGDYVIRAQRAVRS